MTRSKNTKNSIEKWTEFGRFSRENRVAPLGNTRKTWIFKKTKVKHSWTACEFHFLFFHNQFKSSDCEFYFVFFINFIKLDTVFPLFLLLLTLSVNKIYALHVSVNSLHRFAAGDGADQHLQPISFKYHRKIKLEYLFTCALFCVLCLQDSLNRTN